MEIKKVLKNWDIGKIQKIKLSEKGEVNYNWLVETDKGKYFLRKFLGSHSMRDLKFEIDYLKKIQNQGFSYKTPNPIATTGNKFFVKSGGKYFWLDNFIEGEIKEIFNKGALSEVAKMISSYHNILESLKLKCNKKDNLDFARKDVLSEINGFIKKLGGVKRLSKNEKIYLDETKKLISILKELNVKEYSKLKNYAIHRDLNPENILWLRGKISGVLDFENVSQGNDSFIKDICLVIQYGCSDKNHKLNFRKAQFFISEYRKYRKLRDTEIKLIPEIIAAGFIEDFEYQFWLWMSDQKRAKTYRFKLYSEVAQWYWNNKSKILEKLK
jgi:homoserine kinase type II